MFFSNEDVCHQSGGSCNIYPKSLVNHDIRNDFNENSKSDSYLRLLIGWHPTMAFSQAVGGDSDPWQLLASHGSQQILALGHGMTT